MINKVLKKMEERWREVMSSKRIFLLSGLLTDMKWQIQVNELKLQTLLIIFPLTLTSIIASEVGVSGSLTRQLQHHFSFQSVIQTLNKTGVSLM